MKQKRGVSLARLCVLVVASGIGWFGNSQIVYASYSADGEDHESEIIPGEVHKHHRGESGESDSKAWEKALKIEKKAMKKALELESKAIKSTDKRKRHSLRRTAEESNTQNTANNNNRGALILYDAPSSVPMKKLGLAYAIMLRNLLGHFDMNVELLPVEDYAQSNPDSFDTIFYLGNYFSNPLPESFLADVVSTDKTVVWFKYNIWQLTQRQDLGFAQKFGFDYKALKGMNDIPTAANPNPGFFDTVLYKGKPLVKYYDFNVDTQQISADPDIGVVEVSDQSKAQVLVDIINSNTAEEAPYITRSGNFWYVADLPFSFIGPRDRYLVISDILHDMLGIDHPENHKAMVRLEDVSALVKRDTLGTLADYLNNQSIPFSIATIPFYNDPLGSYTGGIPQETPMYAAQELLESLDYATKRGGTVVMHGYTHQYGSTPNPHTGVSADDFEFWDVVNNSPVAEDSVRWASKRIKSGLKEFRSNGYRPNIWTTPHYQASPKSYKAIAKKFDSRYERSFYYTANDPQLNLGVNDPERDYSVGQFFPYVIASDYYGQRVLPENLGNIEYDISSIDPASYIVYTWEDLLINAEHALIVRDGFASFFFHPFWLDPNVPITTGFEDFQKVIEGVSDLGYTWVGASELAKGSKRKNNKHKKRRKNKDHDDDRNKHNKHKDHHDDD